MGFSYRNPSIVQTVYGQNDFLYLFEAIATGPAWPQACWPHLSLEFLGDAMYDVLTTISC